MIFTTHVYTQQELIDSPRIRKVMAICGKIGSDVLCWRENGKLPDEGVASYKKAREQISRKLRNINNTIRDRKPTNIERWLSIFTNVGRLVLKLLPTVMKLLNVFMPLPASDEKIVLLLTRKTPS